MRPLTDPLSGNATVVAERIRLTTLPDAETGAESETLTGSGTLDFADRELRNINVQLAGAGTWDIRGQYTRQNVNVQANFTETTFTPLLALVPGLAEQNPRLKGSLNVAVVGDYGQPQGTLDARNLRGALGDISLDLPQLTGRLNESGDWTLGGALRTGGALDSAGTLRGSGQWRGWQLAGSTLGYSGQLAPRNFGTLPNVQATLAQDSADPDRWVLDARSDTQNAATGRGTLEVSGQLIPSWDLSVRATNYDLAVRTLYLRESALNAALTLREDVGGDDIRVSGSANFARAILGRLNATDDLSTLVPDPENPLAGDAEGDQSDFVSPLPEQYTTFPNLEPEGKRKRPRPARHCHCWNAWYWKTFRCVSPAASSWKTVWPRPRWKVDWS
ncbi:hypothetical protein [Deinococcus radiophilus]|uniref:hypothetical protein n=1 Tax=Deinococcus radiophilus TaxID=32062 RepID=UPI00360607A5